MLKLIPTAVAVVGAVAGVYSPDLQTVVADSPTTSLLVACLAAIITHLLPSPVKKD